MCGPSASGWCTTVRDRAFAEHWDGKSWTRVRTPGGSQYGENLLTVSGSSPTDVWAVGGVVNEYGHQPRANMLHWDGTRWASVDFPLECDQYSSFAVHGIEALTSSDAWLVGSTCFSSPYPDGGLLAHWDGAAWSLVEGPSHDPDVRRGDADVDQCDLAR